MSSSSVLIVNFVGNNMRKGVDIMKLRIKVWLLCILMGGALISGGAAVKSIGSAESTAPPKAAVRNEDSSATYWLYDSGGYIAVYSGDKKIEVTDIETQTLTDYDRELLQSGIPAKDEAELMSLLEDLSS